MAYFAARDDTPAEVAREHVLSSDVYVGLIGFRYGSAVNDRLNISYTEFEFETAAEAGIPRLMFLLGEDAQGPKELFIDPEHEHLQMGFRERLRSHAGGLTLAYFSTADELETKLMHALLILRRTDEAPRRQFKGRIPRCEQIFVSHATADRPLLDSFIDFLVLAGVPEESLFYSSQRSTGIPTGLAFVDHIKRQLQGAIIVVQIITETYLMQPFCLAELGAQWALESRTFPIAIPPITSSHVSGLLAGVQVATLNDDTIQELFHVFTDELGLELNQARWNRAYNRILRDVSKLIEELPPTPFVPRTQLEAVEAELADVKAQLDLYSTRLYERDSRRIESDESPGTAR